MIPFLAAKFTGAATQAPRFAPRFGLGPKETLIFQIIIIALALFIVWWLLKDQKKSFNKNDTPLDILNKRYAAGELTKEDYTRIKKDIQ